MSRLYHAGGRSLVAGWILFLACACSPNHAPAFQAIPDQTVLAGQTLQFNVTATDQDGDALQFWMENGPAHAQFLKLGPTTAAFVWTPQRADAGEQGEGKTHAVAFHASDGWSRGSVSVNIRVGLEGGDSGVPQFISASEFTIDMSGRKYLKFTAEVADDSATVTISQKTSLQGVTLTPNPEKKTAEVIFQPTSDMAAQQPIWSLQLQAVDAEGNTGYQTVTFKLINDTSACPTQTQAPTISHTELPDQRTAENYVITANASDAESNIKKIELRYLIEKAGETKTEYTPTPLTLVSGTQYSGSIPNPGLAEGQTATVSYYICAWDDDDQTADTCDRQTCIPQDGRFSFTAYSPSDPTPTCSDSELEPNETATAARTIREGSYSDLKICPNDQDWFSVALNTDSRVTGTIRFTESNGPLGFDLLDATGGSVLVSGSKTEADMLTLTSSEVSQATTLLLRVMGQTTSVENSYSLQISIHTKPPPECTDIFDQQIANDSPATATDLDPKLVDDHFSESGLKICESDTDWFKIFTFPEDRIQFEITFSAAGGDLDMILYHPDVIEADEDDYFLYVVDHSEIGTSSEQIDYHVPDVGGGYYYLQVYSFLEEANDYSLSVTLIES